MLNSMWPAIPPGPRLESLQCEASPDEQLQPVGGPVQLWPGPRSPQYREGLAPPRHPCGGPGARRPLCGDLQRKGQQGNPSAWPAGPEGRRVCRQGGATLPGCGQPAGQG